VNSISEALKRSFSSGFRSTKQPISSRVSSSYSSIQFCTFSEIDLFGNLDREEKKKYNIHEVKGRWTTKKE
jgi:hypothetical protein